MDILSQYSAIVHQIVCDNRGTPITYRPRAGDETTLTAFVQFGAEFEAASNGAFCSVKMQLTDLAAAPMAGDEIGIASLNATCQVIKDGLVLDGYGGVTVYAKFLRPLA